MEQQREKFYKNAGRIVSSCRMCKGGNLDLFLDLEFHPPSDRFLTKEELSQPETHYPLRVLLCQDCGQMQLNYVIPADILYLENYPYESSITRTGRDHFFEMARDVSQNYEIPKGSLAIDVGSNVGVLLSGFREQGMKILGVDPALNMAETANANGIETIPTFFSTRAAEQIIKRKGKAHIITGTNVFAHIDDLDDFMKAIDILLEKKGVLVIEAPYAVNLIQNLEYDTVYHEHLGYLSVKPLTKFFKRFGMELFDVKRVAIHGGSARYFVACAGTRKVTSHVRELLALEKKVNIYSMTRLRKFALAVRNQRAQLLDMLYKLKKDGKRIVAVSAPAKGNTLLNYCKIGPETLDYVTEKSKLKIGLFTPGMHIPVVPDDRLLKDQPDYALILAWNFAEEIMENLKEYRRRGGRFIIPLPKPVIK